ncbi:MAG: hypothetical protein GWM90_30860 [Gemmatimonadetes bacterium]|nr:hypothetical protein [Gemmatimonadota bacterium]NIQ59592.1 hypothetical protein [Gemmatimonadota bacterium]NIU79798.1 hypothetical protein [Gammaproteobacteria bacterium]NIX48302.1 hypothetical protein [Gemmatimonadota bacterium]NIY12747.1 hypothetical protein [Gemmatimonadota bacterium]
MEPERVDLSPLDPSLDRLRYERLVRRIVDAAAPELARRAGEAGPLAALGAWARPTLTAAAVIAALAVGTLVAVERGRDAPATMVDALGVPAPAAEWLEQGREPTASDLVLAVESRP